ncbi:hypothetical protein K402DRAFT_168366 [Aulographum hederae CBS 113979]|uniref:CID domain-containing protein n=1 Tax=Aulographum hederae CBS 113979 TaxID=1176131 RepID=A0A6G1HCU4_9PEZI|nr:hypothetical protein K402DRAFT_168366 [Aulographum hederae CBS 113979]
MADPFEVRVRFTQHLTHLNASVNSAQKAANYALKHRDMDEDLHSCILEQLERNNMNNRANIMYFIEHLCDAAAKENHPEFIRMVRRDILQIIDAVAPADGSGAANIKVVRRVINGLKKKNVLMAQTVDELEECLHERDVGSAHPAFSDDVSPSPTEPGQTATGMRQTPPSRPYRANGASRTSGVKLDRKQMEQRIEEDRERHKRMRENAWAITAQDEFEKAWEEASEFNDDDYEAAAEDTDMRQQIVMVSE